MEENKKMKEYEFVEANKWAINFFKYLEKINDEFPEEILTPYGRGIVKGINLLFKEQENEKEEQ